MMIDDEYEYDDNEDDDYHESALAVIDVDV